MSMHSDEVTPLTAPELVAERSRLEFEAPLPTIDHVIGNPAPAFTQEEATFATPPPCFPSPSLPTPPPPHIPPRLRPRLRPDQGRQSVCGARLPGPRPL